MRYEVTQIDAIEDRLVRRAHAGDAVVAPVREAVADWLGIGSTRIETAPADQDDLAALPDLYADLSPVTPGAASAELGRPLPEVTHPRLGDPSLVATPSEGGVIVAWERGSTTLWIRPHDPSVAPDRRKLASDASAVQPIGELGEQGWFVQGEHELVTPDRRVAAASVVLWIDDGLEYRLESEFGRETMLAIARSVVR